MPVRVRLFAACADAAGRSTLEIKVVVGCTVGRLVTRLRRTHPRFPNRLLIAVNQEYAGRWHVLKPGDEVALLPPFSGGAGRPHFVAGLTSRPLGLDPLLRFVRDPAAGAVCVFLGVVRRTSGSLRVRALDYSAFRPRADRDLAALARRLLQRYRITRVAIVHRLGRIRLGETAVAVVVSAPHRPAAFAAGREGIDRVKRTIPIWKKDVRAYPGGHK